MGRFLGCHCTSAFLGRHEILFSAFDCNHPGHHLPGYGQCGSVAIAPLFFLFVNQAQFMAVSRCQFRRFDQHLLNMLVGRLSPCSRLSIEGKVKSRGLEFRAYK